MTVRRHSLVFGILLALLATGCAEGGEVATGAPSREGSPQAGAPPAGMTPPPAPPVPPPDPDAEVPEEMQEVTDELFTSSMQFEQDASEAEPAVLTSGGGGNAVPDLSAAAAYLTAVIQHADTVWTAWFKGNGLAEPYIGYYVISPGYQYTSNCVIEGQRTFQTDYPNALYCDLDSNAFNDPGMVILPLTTFQKMWGGIVLNRPVADASRVGDFAAAVITAHEFGHHVEYELARQLRWPHPVGQNQELVADCFAGVWAYTVYLDGYLEAGDLEEGAAALEAIGDNIGSHGTSAERRNAFLIGYSGSQADPRGGVPVNCLNAFWLNRG